ncbi:hypothetical protein J6590_101996 [Homalodisca vitripennis]|nr:hypothetical protein J6590_101996 [Homalodisca vitripennis]
MQSLDNRRERPVITLPGLEHRRIVSLTELMAGVKAPPRTVQLFQLTCWPMGHRVPTSTNSLVELMNMVERWRQRTDYGPVVVISQDGRGRCGVYCAANACIEQVIQHGEVDIFQAVKTVRRHRPQLIENMTEYKYCYDLVLHYFGRGAALPLTPEDEVVDLTPSSDGQGPGPSNSGRYVYSRPKLSRQANVTEDSYEPTHTLRGDFPYADEMCNDNSFALYDRNARLNLRRPKSFSECVHFSYSCSEIAETTFTVPVEINKVDGDQSVCSTLPPSCSTRDNTVAPVTEGPPLDVPDAQDITHVKVDRKNSDVFCQSEKSDYTPTEDLYFYTDCQALFHTNSTTEDDIFYSQLEDLTLSTISVSEDLPTDGTEAYQSTFCCDVFTPGLKDDTKSVLAEDLEEDPVDVQCPEQSTELEPAAPTSHVQNHFSDCFPI